MFAQWFAGSIPFMTAFVATLAAARLLEPLARKLRWVDHPRGRKAHASALPLTGGVAIVAGVAAAIMVDGRLATLSNGIGAGAMVLLASGIADDFLDLPWPLRLALQAAAMLAMIHFGGIRVHYLGTAGEPPVLEPLWLSLLFSVFVGVGVINAFNMVDGGDGIAASITLASLLLFGIACTAAGNFAITRAIVAIAGAVGGFFVLNMRFPWQRHARLFLGDAGSSLIGLAVVWVALQATQAPRSAIESTLAPWFFAPPLVDCIATILRRLRQRRSPFRADRGHLHHLLLDAGIAPARVAWLLGALTFALGGSALLAFRLGLPPPLLAGTFVALTALHAALTGDCARFVTGVRRLRRCDDTVAAHEPRAQ